MRRTMGRHRKRSQPPIPSTIPEFYTQLTGVYANQCTVHGLPLSINLIEVEGPTLLFILPEVKTLLRTEKTFLLDDTFSSAPSFQNQCQQLYVLMGLTHNTGFPIAFAIMSKTTEQAYENLFKKILELEPEWLPDVLIANYEMNAMVALKTIFPNSMVEGCWSHSSQAIWRKVNSLGMINLCKTCRGSYDAVHMLMALPLLPSYRIMSGYLAVRDFYNVYVQDYLNRGDQEKFDQLFHYYHQAWLMGIHDRTISICRAILTTNHMLEVLHRHLHTHFAKDHNPRPWEFLNGLIKYSSRILIEYRHVMDSVQIMEPHLRVWQNYQNNLDRAGILLFEGRMDISDFLMRMQQITPNFGIPRPPTRPWYELERLIIPPLPSPRPGSPLLQEIDYDEEGIPILPIPRPPIMYIERDALNFQPIIEESCYICLNSPTNVILFPCNHQGLCLPCFETLLPMPRFEPFLTIPPFLQTPPRHTCGICRTQIDRFIVLTNN